MLIFSMLWIFEYLMNVVEWKFMIFFFLVYYVIFLWEINEIVIKMFKYI